MPCKVFLDATTFQLYVRQYNSFRSEFWSTSCGIFKLLLFSEIKERIKKTKDEKKAKKAEVMAKSQKTQGKANISKGAAPKGPKLGGGGGKRWATR